MAIAGQMTGAAGAAAPPPLLPTAAWFLGIGGQQQGPFDVAGLQARVRDGSLTRSTLVWKQGMANWSPAETVPELQALFAAAPPPLPTR
jgi:hypothetical protein